MLTVVQAFERSPIAEIMIDGAAALEAKLSAASSAFADKANWLHPYERLDVLRRLVRLIEQRRDSFVRLIAREGGKPLSDAIVETTRAIDGVRDAAGELRNFNGHEIPMGLTQASARRWAFTFKEPIGVVAAISAFNHPLNLIVHLVAPAIAVGCPVVVKPASATPLCCRDFVDLVHEAGLPEAWCQMFLPEDNALAEKFATDPRIAFLSFIGSARVGWHLHHRLAPGARAALEHGGVAPAIVDRSANLDAIIEPMVKGGYYHAGQVCVSTQRILVHEEIKDAFVERFTARVSALRVGDPLLQATEVGPLIHPKEVERVASWIDQALTEGAQVATGGRRLSETTYEPTILVEPRSAPRSPRRRSSAHSPASTAIPTLTRRSVSRTRFRSLSKRASPHRTSTSRCTPPIVSMPRRS
jgi:acyl-CoA reductase-like NAD-dependent aldehyde dehydrogenase